MTLLIAVSDPLADAELLASARNLAAAARWEATGVHVRRAGEPELPSADVEGLEVAEVEGEPAEALAAFVDRADAEALALGLRTRVGSRHRARGRDAASRVTASRCSWSGRACVPSPACAVSWCRWRAVRPARRP